MPVLNAQQLDERIALYKTYRDAVAKLDGLIASLPEAAPEQLVVTWGVDLRRGGALTQSETDAEVAFAPRARVRFVTQRAWPALRKAVIADAEKELADAEQAVLAFERGEDVTPAAGAENNAPE